MVNKQSGQSLLFVIVAMTIALSIGVAVTSRTLSSLRRTSSSDTSSRVYSAAEGGIEWFLRQPVTVLDKLADGDNGGGGECPTGTTGAGGSSAGCVITYEPQENDAIQSQATVTVRSFSFNQIQNGESHYWFAINPGGVKEVALKDFKGENYYHGNIQVCWKTLESSQSSALYLVTYGADGLYEKRLVSPTTIQPGTTFNMSGDAIATGGRLEYDSCYGVNIPGDVDLLGLRVKSLYAPSKIAVFPDADNFPTQGFEITSLGELDNTVEKIKATKQIKVYRSLPYAPSLFDYGIYSAQSIN